MSIPPRNSPLIRGLQPLGDALWIMFLVWTTLLGAVWMTGWGEAEVGNWVAKRFLTEVQRAANEQSPLSGALQSVMRMVDPIWMILAFVVVYTRTVRVEGLGTARRWVATVLLAGVVVMLASTWLGWPLGHVHFSSRLGMRLGPISMGALLLWPVVVLGSRELARRGWPQANPWTTGLVAGVASATTALNIEPVANQLRAWWVWNPGLPALADAPLWRVGLTWGTVTAALVCLLRQPQVARTREQGLPKAVLVLLLLNVLCLAARLTRG